MKKILNKVAGSVLIVLVLFSCKNKEVVFPDFKYTSSYFPFQFPIRTLVLGDYIFDNSNDQKLKFVISVGMGGVYENKEDILVNFVIDESLTNNLYIGNNKILPLPKAYYTLSNPSQFIIPKGQFHGGIEGQLTEAFLNDPKAVGHLGTSYVVPLRIVSATTDSVLVGKTTNATADPRIAGDWVTTPKNFTLYGINYVNEYHGRYLVRGASQVRAGSNLIESNVYRTQFVETDAVVEVNTTGRRQVTYTNKVVREAASSPGNFVMNIIFDENGGGVISKAGNSPFNVTGSAKFVKNAESWGAKPRHAIYLDYQVNEGSNTHTAKDTLVFRDKAVEFQEFVPVIK